MSDPLQEQLLGYLLGALDDDEQGRLVSRLACEPALCGELESMRRRLEPLEVCRQPFDPPPGLAERTCRLVAMEAHRAGGLATARRLPSMSAPAWQPGRIGRVGWLDMAIAVAVFFTAALATIPAIESSRFHARVTACQDKLREVGAALTQYSERHQGYFPVVPAGGKLAAAGIYAPTLLDDGLLTDASQVVCPGSPLAENTCFRVPTLDQLRAAPSDEVPQLRERMGGSYGYCLGHMRDGVYRGTKNLRRPQFAIAADAPSPGLPGLQSLNHEGRGENVLFEDGHVTFVVSPKATPTGDDIYTNDDGVVAAGVHPGDAVIGSSSSAPIIYVGNR